MSQEHDEPSGDMTLFDLLLIAAGFVVAGIAFYQSFQPQIKAFLHIGG